MARVCRRFFSTAITYIWMDPADGKSGYGFECLARLWMHTGALEKDTEGVYRYTRPLSNHDWERFNVYAPYVIILRATACPSFPSPPPDVVGSPQLSLFSNLQQLLIKPTARVALDSWIPLIGRSLRRIDIDIHKSLEAVGTLNEILSRRFFDAISMRCADLETITIASLGDFPPYLINVVISWHRLKNATFWGFNSLPMELVSSLSALPDLDGVRLGDLARGIDLAPLGGFNALQRYSSMGYAESTGKVLQHISSSQMTAIEMTLQIKIFDVGFHDHSDVIHEISRFTALEALYVGWCGEGGMRVEGFIIVPNIMELTSLRNLRRVVIGDTSLRIKMSSGDLYSLTQAWPRLRELTIEMSKPYPLVQSLAVLQKHCPVLEYLEMSVDSRVSRSAAGGEDRSHPSVKHVNLSESIGGVAAVRDVAWVLDEMWPNADFKCGNTWRRFASWGMVESHMKGLRIARARR
ncbi:hypothetical protein FRB96_006716 [Tulasnella sp. 330]|nr:hypothetical protein FRB96_006716 [Tulasnella sp. 330]